MCCCPRIALSLLSLVGCCIAQRPNVVLIMTDDQGYGDLGATGNPVIRTPNLDAMAKRSAWMANFYVSPVCAPTRACLMTGRYNYRTRVVDTWVGRAMMEPDEVTVAEVLRDAGYATGIFGKWHLGDCYPLRPIDQGFGEALVHRGGGIGQPADPLGGEGKYTDAVLFHNGERVETEGYCTDVYFDAAMRWIDAQHRAKQSFFAYIPTNCPHGPFDDVPTAEFAAYEKTDLGNAAFPRQGGHALPDQADLDRRRRIFSMITNVDANVGRLLGKLETLGLTENTLVIFMVDNGPNARRYVAGMRGRKSDVYEGGVRSPFFAQWPARLEAGARSDRIAAHIDVMPTLLEACGVPLPDGVRLDGRSFLPLLERRPVAWPDRTLFIQVHRGDVPIRYHHFMARSQRWKLVRPSGFSNESLDASVPFELYDMRDDPLETRDLASRHPDVVAAMKTAYDAWFDDVSTTRPDNYAPPRIHLGTPHENPATLTRQDWRRLATSGGWGSRGYWAVHIPEPARFDVAARFQPTRGPAELELRVGDGKWSAELASGVTSWRFEDLPFDRGDARIEATVVSTAEKQGVLQLDVSRRR